MKDGATAWGGEDGAALEEFMSAGKTPVYVGWGSMILWQNWNRFASLS